MASGETAALLPLKYQVFVLKVYIHCEGCKKKVKRVLRKIDGVYTVTFGSDKGRVTVVGDVDGETLVNKLAKSGKKVEVVNVINEQPLKKEGPAEEKKNGAAGKENAGTAKKSEGGRGDNPTTKANADQKTAENSKLPNKTPPRKEGPGREKTNSTGGEKQKKETEGSTGEASSKPQQNGESAPKVEAKANGGAMGKKNGSAGDGDPKVSKEAGDRNGNKEPKADSTGPDGVKKAGNGVDEPPSRANGPVGKKTGINGDGKTGILPGASGSEGKKAAMDANKLMIHCDPYFPPQQPLYAYPAYQPSPVYGSDNNMMYPTGNYGYYSSVPEAPPPLPAYSSSRSPSFWPRGGNPFHYHHYYQPVDDEAGAPACNVM